MANITYRGERFSGYNKPKRTPSASKSHAVLIKDNGKEYRINNISKRTQKDFLNI